MYEHATKKKCGVPGSHWQDLNLRPPRCGLALLPTELETPVVAYAIYHHLVQLGSYVTCAPHIARISNVESIMFLINERWWILSLLNRTLKMAGSSATSMGQKNVQQDSNPRVYRQGCDLRKITRSPKFPNYEIQGAQLQHKAYMTKVSLSGFP